MRETVRSSGGLYVLFRFSSAIFWYGGWPFLKGLTLEHKSLKPGMMTLVAVAILELSRATYRKMIENFFWTTGLQSALYAR